MGGQIECITKAGGHEIHHITHVGGRTLNPQIMKVENVIKAIDAGEQFFTQVAGTKATVKADRTGPNGRRYIYTEPDHTKKDNLLSLPACP
jgi:hypothetical protein